MKRIISMMLAVFMLISLCACSKTEQNAGEETKTEKKYEEKEVTPNLEFARLAGAAESIWNQMTCGFFEYDPEKKADFDENYFAALNPEFDSIDDVKALIETVFTKECAQRYFYDNWAKEKMPPFVEKDGVLYVLAGGKGWPYSYDSMTLKMIESTDDMMKFTVDRLAFDEIEGLSMFIMKKEDGVWKFDNTFAEANEYSQASEDLQK